MAVVISEIVTEFVVSQPGTATGSATGSSGQGGTQLAADAVDEIVRRAAERVLETLRREWDL